MCATWRLMARCWETSRRRPPPRHEGGRIRASNCIQAWELKTPHQRARRGERIEHIKKYIDIGMDMGLQLTEPTMTKYLISQKGVAKRTRYSAMQLGTVQRSYVQKLMAQLYE